MNQKIIEEEIEKLRKEFPAMFSHPDLMEGELFTGKYIRNDGAVLIEISLRNLTGFKSARLGKNPEVRKFGSEEDFALPVFIKFWEAAELNKSG